MAKTLKDHQKFIELRAKGLSYDKISKELGMNKNTCVSLSKKYEIEIQNTKQIELEAIREEFFLMKKQKISILADQLKKVREQLEIRDFSDVSTIDLIKLQSDLITAIELEFNRSAVLFKQKKPLIDDFSFGIESWEG